MHTGTRPKLTKEEFEAFIPQNGYVMILPERGNDEVLMKKSGDKELFIPNKTMIEATIEKKKELDEKDNLKYALERHKDTKTLYMAPNYQKEFKPHEHACVRGTLLKAAKEVPTDYINLFRWETDIAVKPGDTVYYRHGTSLLATQADADGGAGTKTSYNVTGFFMCFIVEGLVDGQDKEVIYIPYTELMCKQSPEDFGTDKINTLNGYVLVEPDGDSPDLGFLALPEMLKALVSEKTGVVRYCDSDNTRYLDDDPYGYPLYPPDNTVHIQPGDRVVMDVICDIPLEYHIHAHFKKKFYTVHKKDLIAVISADAKVDKVKYNSMVGN